ncbi:hypothetical protein D3C73_1047980 [compost metagenome]
MALNLDMRVQTLQLGNRCTHAFHPQMLRIHQNLPVQIRRDNNPFMGQNKPADTRRSQIQRSRSSQPANSRNHHRRFLQRPLPLFSEQLKLPGIPFQLQISGKLLHPCSPLLPILNLQLYPSRLNKPWPAVNSLYFSKKARPSSTHSTP